MAEDPNAPLETPAATPVDAQETAVDSGAGAAPAPVETPKVDLHQVPEYRRMQSEAAQAKNRAEAAERRAAMIEAQMSNLEKAIGEINPDALSVIEAQRAKDLADQQLESLQRDLFQARLDQWNMAAVTSGIDMNSREAKLAYQLLLHGDTSGMQALIDDAAAKPKTSAAQKPPVPQTETPQETTVAAPKQPKPGYALPPSGSAPRATDAQRIEALRAERQKAIAEAKRNGIPFAQVRDEFAQKAREQGLNPRDIEPQN